MKIEEAFNIVQKLPPDVSKAISARAKGLVDPLLEKFGAMARMAVQFVGRELVEETIEKNLILLIARLLKLTEQFDKASIDKKLDILQTVVETFIDEASLWSEELEEMYVHIHSKKERRERRHHRPHHELAPLRVSVVEKLVPLLLPEGIASLYLPPSVSLIRSQLEKKLDISSFLDNVLVALFERPNKINLLFSAFSSLHIWACMGSGLPATEEEISEQHIDRMTPAIERFICLFIPSFSERAHLLPKRMIAEKALSLFLGYCQCISLGDLLVNLVLKSPLAHSEESLKKLIERISQDECAVRKVISRLFPPSISKLPETPSFFEILSFGLKTSATSFVADSLLSSTDWPDVLFDLFDRMRLFVLSPYFERAIFQSVLILLS